MTEAQDTATLIYSAERHLAESLTKTLKDVDGTVSAEEKLTYCKAARELAEGLGALRPAPRLFEPTVS